MMKLKLMPSLLGALALIIAATPIRVRAGEPMYLSQSASVHNRRADFTPEQRQIISNFDLSPKQQEKLRHIKPPLTYSRIRPILTSGQRHEWLKKRHQNGGA